MTVNLNFHSKPGPINVPQAAEVNPHSPDDAAILKAPVSIMV
jgi:hypothetical protein